MIKKHNAWGFTLIEVIIVVIIITILLWSTLFVWFAYVKTMQVKNQKQAFISLYDQFAANARTSNYIGTSRYNEITITIDEWGISWTAELEDETVISLDSYIFPDLIAVFSWSDSLGTIDIDIEPYAIWCNDILVSSVWVSQSSVDIQLVSSINDDVYCLEIDGRTCKISQTRCD